MATINGNAVWRHWQCYGTAGTSTATASTAWTVWNTGATAGTTTASDTVWYSWVDDAINTIPNQNVIIEAEWEARSRRYKELEKEREAAEQKAKDLLLDLIGADELKVYEETGRLFVRGKKYDYIVQKDGFIKRIEKDKITDLCVHLVNRQTYPATDNVVAMKLAIENDEEKILRLANNKGSRNREADLPLAACM